MSKKSSQPISPEMTVLDIVNRFRHTQAIFEQYDALAGECICCNSLFETLKTVASKYNLDLDDLVRNLSGSLETL